MWWWFACAGEPEPWDPWFPGPDSGVEADSGSDEDSAPENVPVSDVEPTVVWSTSGVTLSLEGGAGSYRFGLAETGAGLGGWYGEDCLDGAAGYAYCHAFEGATLSLSVVDQPWSVVSGSSTLLVEDQSSGLTYVVFDAEDRCLAWGHDPGYYAERGCTPPEAP